MFCPPGKKVAERRARLGKAVNSLTPCFQKSDSIILKAVARVRWSPAGQGGVEKPRSTGAASSWRKRCRIPSSCADTIVICFQLFRELKKEETRSTLILAVAVRAAKLSVTGGRSVFLILRREWFQRQIFPSFRDPHD